jgi:hypothetical protein
MKIDYLKSFSDELIKTSGIGSILGKTIGAGVGVMSIGSSINESKAAGRELGKKYMAPRLNRMANYQLDSGNFAGVNPSGLSYTAI